MGYSTNFVGKVNLDKPLTPEHKSYLEAFSQVRHMKRDANKTVLMPDSIRKAVGLPVGDDGAYYVGDVRGNDVLDHNNSPKEQPGLWCQWTPSTDGLSIEWDEGEKFYKYTEWLEYIITHFIKPLGYTLNGTVEWSGESPGDSGKITVKDNVVSVKT